MKMKGHCFCVSHKSIISAPKVNKTQKSTKSRKKWFKKKRRSVSNTTQAEITPATATPNATGTGAPILAPIITRRETPEVSGVNKEEPKHAYTTPIVELMKLNGADNDEAKMSGVDMELTEPSGMDKGHTKHAYAIALSKAKFVEPSVEIKRAAAKVGKLKKKSKKWWYRKKKREVSVPNTTQPVLAPIATSVPPVIPVTTEPPKMSTVDKEDVKHAYTTQTVEPPRLSEVNNEFSKHALATHTVELEKLSETYDEPATQASTVHKVESVKPNEVDKDDAKHDKDDAKHASMAAPIVEPLEISEVDKKDPKHASTVTPILKPPEISEVDKKDPKHASTVTPILKPPEISEVDKEDPKHASTVTPIVKPPEISGVDKEDEKHASGNHTVEPLKVTKVDKEDAERVSIVKPMKASKVEKEMTANPVKLSEAVKKVAEHSNIKPVVQPAKLSRISKEKSKHVSGSATKAAAEVIRLKIEGLFVDNSKEELAAVKIQSAYRGYMGRRRLRAIRGLMMMKSVMHKRQAVKRQGSNTLKCMQTLTGMQSQFRERVLKMAHDNLAAHKCERASAAT